MEENLLAIPTMDGHTDVPSMHVHITISQSGMHKLLTTLNESKN